MADHGLRAEVSVRQPLDLMAYGWGWTFRITESLGRKRSGMRRIHQQFRESGGIKPMKRGDRSPPKVGADEHGRPTQLVAEHPDAASAWPRRLVTAAGSPLLAALGHQSMRCSNVIDGAINGDHFAVFVEKTLVPVCKPGDIVVLDNLSSNRLTDAREMIEAIHASLCFLPPYSPDLNPIKNAFSKLQRLYESVSHRTYDRRDVTEYPGTAEGDLTVRCKRLPLTHAVYEVIK